jgi:hypothetical protein
VAHALDEAVLPRVFDRVGGRDGKGGGTGTGTGGGGGGSGGGGGQRPSPTLAGGTSTTSIGGGAGAAQEDNYFSRKKARSSHSSMPAASCTLLNPLDR